VKFLFLPALSSQLTRFMPGGLASAQYAGKPTRSSSPMQRLRCPNWMDEQVRGTQAYYPHVLASYYYFRNIALALPKDGYVFGDSGGFSLMRHDGEERAGVAPHQRRLDPVDVLEWQARLCSVGALVDKPPVDGSGNRIWELALTITAKNARDAAEAYPCVRERFPDFRWWGVVHGRDGNDLERWYQAIRAIYAFEAPGEGWAFKPRPASDPVGTARCLSFIRQHPEITRAHFFAAASPQAVAVICALGAGCGLEFASADAETSGNLARNRKLLRPTPDCWGYRYGLAEVGEERTCRDYLLWKCTCFSCQALREDAERFPEVVMGKYNEYWLHRFHFHNHLAQVRVMQNIIEAAANQPDALLRAVLGKGYGPVLRVFDGQPDQAALPATAVRTLRNAA